MVTLSATTLENLIRRGWSCDNYPGFCDIGSHKGKTHKLLYDPDGLLSEDQIVERCLRGTTLSLHVGEAIPEKVYRRKWLRAKRVVPWMKDRIVVPKGTFVFLLTRECVDMPLDVEGELYMVPRLSNLGLLFFTLGHVHPGFHGRLTATLLNMTDRNIVVDPDATFLSLVCRKVDAPVKPHPTYHEEAQLTIDEAQRNLYYNQNPGFVLTSEKFATRGELMRWVAIVLAITFGLFGPPSRLIEILVISAHSPYKLRFHQIVKS